MKENVLFLGIGEVDDGRFWKFYEPFRKQENICYVIHRSPQQSVFRAKEYIKNYFVYDYLQNKNEALSYLVTFCKKYNIENILNFYKFVIAGERFMCIML